MKKSKPKLSDTQFKVLLNLKEGHKLQKTRYETFVINDGRFTSVVLNSVVNAILTKGLICPGEGSTFILTLDGNKIIDEKLSTHRESKKNT